MTEVHEEIQKCPHCGSEEVEQYATADTAKFHEEVKAKGVVIPNPPKEANMRTFITLFGIIIFFIIPSIMDLVLLINLVLISVVILIAFFIRLSYNALRYPSAYSRWYNENINTYICYCCGRSFSYSLVNEKSEQDKTGESRFGDAAAKRNIEPLESSLLMPWFIRKKELINLLSLYAFALMAFRSIVRIMRFALHRVPISSASPEVDLEMCLSPISLADSFLFFNEVIISAPWDVSLLPEPSISHTIFYMIPFVGLLWLLHRRQSGTSLIFAGTIGLIGFLDHICSFLCFIYFFFRPFFWSYFEPIVFGGNDFMPIGFWGYFKPIDFLYFPLPALGFAFMAYKIFRISKSLYGQNFYTNKLKIAGTILLFVFCYALPFLYY